MTSSSELAWCFPRDEHAISASAWAVPPDAAATLRAIASMKHGLTPRDAARLTQAADGVRPMCVATCTAISAYLRAQDGSSGPRSLTAWLKAHGCTPVLLRRTARPTTPPIDDSTPARDAWRSEMHSRAAHREYDNIVADLTSREARAMETGAFRHMSQQIQIGVSALFALLSAAAVGYYLGRQLYGAGSTQEWLFALIAGVVLLVVEMVLLISRLAKVDAAEARSRVAQTQKPLPRAATTS